MPKAKDRSSEQYRIQRLENQVMALQKNLLQTLRLLEFELRYNPESQGYKLLREIVDEVEQITSYKPER